MDLLPAATHVQDYRPQHECWRIQNIPTSWSVTKLLRMLQKQDESLGNLEEQCISLYPSYTRSSQTALLSMKPLPQYFQELDPDESHVLILEEIPEAGSRREDVFLSLDCHFRGLTPLNVPIGDNLVDIVAVTGLGGHAFESWQSRQSDQMWLKDFLPCSIPENIRILTYGYNSSLTKPGKRSMVDYRRGFVQVLSNARSAAEERARPLIFIGHSLGCILIAQALLQAQNNRSDSHILDSTRVAFLFGAPHGGQKVDDLVSMVKDITSSSSSSQQSRRLRLLEHLREDSDFLDDQRERLISIWEKMKIISFYEKRDTKTVKKNVAGEWERTGGAARLVQGFSSLLYLKQESRYAIDEDHINMVRFVLPTDKHYECVSKVRMSSRSITGMA
ncbi:uncharacterized protein H6S33_011134 [Morchella sextelata]|uniref:uncharacterized protein n=1 Tax=Morchella sextelata TaxID=1174677 RepID=UPI001D0551DB|nr:uncharacterized protein H6S33_011134 [Morchella sextelata]KAH0611869.1 hypothetical protein H6S33_011134 [Morchella sextelata]